MNDIQNIITERIDDIPLLLEQMQRMHLPTLIDHHFPTHGNWQGLSLGWVSTIWLSSILSRGDHRLVHVEPWVNNRLWTLRRATGQAVECLDFTDDRLELVLQHVSDDLRWAQCESALNQHTVRVYDLSGARIHVDSTTASAYTLVSEAGLFQFGHSKDHRPDLPQVKVMQAVLDPLGMPVATDVVSGDRADDPQYKIPGVEMVLTTLHSGGKYGQGGYKFSGGTHGVGAKCVNAVSEWFEVEVSRNGEIYQMEFERGKTTKKLEVIGKAKGTGTLVTFKPDPEIFQETIEFKAERIAQRLRELAFLNSNLEITFLDERVAEAKRESYLYKDGIQEFVKQLSKGKQVLHPKPIAFSGRRPYEYTQNGIERKADIIADIVLQYNDSYTAQVLGYTNTV